MSTPNKGKDDDEGRDVHPEVDSSRPVPKAAESNPKLRSEHAPDPANAPVAQPGLAAEPMADPMFSPEEYETFKNAAALGANASRILLNAFEQGMSGRVSRADFDTYTAQAIADVQAAIADLTPVIPVLENGPEDMVFNTYNRIGRDKRRDKDRPIILPPDDHWDGHEGEALGRDTSTRPRDTTRQDHDHDKGKYGSHAKTHEHQASPSKPKGDPSPSVREPRGV